MKKIDELLLELETALRNLEISYTCARESNDKADLLNISASLSVLVCTGGSSMRPLLLDISDAFSIPLEIFSLPLKAKQPSKQFLLSIIDGRTWNTKPEDGLIKYSLRDWIEIPLFYVDETKQHFSRQEMISNISLANEAHHSSEMHDLDDSFFSQWRLSEQNYDGFAATLLDVAAAVLWLGNRFILILKHKSLKNRNFLDPNYRDQELNRIIGAIMILDNRFERTTLG